jgi:hypothetical protein
VKARYQHDCDGCTFKGTYGPFDVYHCARCDGGTWLARRSDDVADYASYPEFVIPQIEQRRDIREDEALSAILHFRGTK